MNACMNGCVNDGVHNRVCDVGLGGVGVGECGCVSDGQYGNTCHIMNSFLFGMNSF